MLLCLTSARCLAAKVKAHEIRNKSKSDLQLQVIKILLGCEAVSILSKY